MSRSVNESIQQPFFSSAIQPKLADNFPIENDGTKVEGMSDYERSIGAPLVKSLYPKYSVSEKRAYVVGYKPIKTQEVIQSAPGPLIQKQDDEQGSSESIEPMDEVGSAGSAPEEAPNVTIELPLPMTIRVNGVMFTSPTFLLEGPNGRIIDLAPYTGSGLLDFPLAALESLGIPVLSFYHFHYGRARQFLGRHFESAYALSGGTSFIRNALHYGYITADDVTLFGAPSSFNLEHYGGIPHLNIVANPMDIGTMINVSYFNYPLFEGHNNPAVLFSINASFDQNPFDAFTNLGGAIYHALSGDLYNLPDVTHSYPRFQREPTEAIGSPSTRTRVSRKSEPGSVDTPTNSQLGQQNLTEKGSGDRLPVQKEKDHTHSNFFLLQPKITISGLNYPNNSRYGQETDAVAEKVGRMPVPQPIFQPFFRPSMSSLQRKCAHCKEESKEVQRKEINRDDIPMDKDLENYVGKLHESGKALSNSEKNFYGPKLGFDFSKVKVHTDHNAAHSAQSINALAYTVGNNIVFNNGQYSPNSDKGKRLLGHELTHVVQQSQAKSNFIQKQDEVLAESEAMRDRFRAERRRDLRRIIDCISFRKIRRDCPSSTGVRLADVLARMRTRVAGNRLCIQFFQERFRINPDIMFDPSRRPSITYVPLLGRSGLTRCPEPTCDSPIPSVSVGTANASDNICNSPLLERTIMHELIHYAHCYRRWGDVGDEATSEAGATICMGSVQEALDAARRRRRATVPP